MVDALGRGGGQNVRPKGLPKFHVNVFGSVDAEPVYAKFFNPIFVDIDHPIDNFRSFGEQIVEAKKIAIQ